MLEENKALIESEVAGSKVFVEIADIVNKDETDRAFERLAPYLGKFTIV